MISQELKNEVIRLYVEEELSVKEISEKLKCAKTSINSWLRKANIPSRPQIYNRMDLTGRRFGRLVVLKRDDECNKKYILKWICKCDCGKEWPVVGSSLMYGSTTSCGCIRREKHWKGYEDLSGSYWNSIQKGAKSRNLECTITIEEAWDLYIKQNKKCALTGVDIKIIPNITFHGKEHTASLDRIENTEGYTINNVRWVHSDINMLRRAYSDDFFIKWCKLVAKHNE